MNPPLREDDPIPVPADRGIGPGFSVYLDLVRFSAAFIVFLSHACKPGLSANILPNLVNQGIDAVTVFFVLSGLVVCYAGHTKDRDLTDFAVSRVARLWSVALPSIAVAAVLAWIGTRFNADLYERSIVHDSFERFDAIRTVLAPTPLPFLGEWIFSGLAAVETAVTSNPLIRACIGGFFLNEIWGFSIVQFWNAPYWSLGYEFWYYVIFALVFYLRGWRGPAAGLAAMLVAGPKILLLLPVWLLGVIVYYWRPALPRWLAWFCVIGSILAYPLLIRLGVSSLLRRIDSFVPLGLGWSYNFSWHYVVGFLTACNFIAFNSLHGIEILNRMAEPIRWLAAKTLSLYLFHLPILYCVAACWPGDRQPIVRSVVLIVGTLVAVYLLSLITEARKDWWRAMLLYGLRAVRNTNMQVVQSRGGGG